MKSLLVGMALFLAIVFSPLHGSAVADEVELNNGRKWEMDEHTRTSFAEMAKSFSEADKASAKKEELKKIGSDLMGDIDVLIEGCTMTGDAHDQLHTYLMEYIAAVEALSQSGEREDAQKVEGYLENYGKYFQ